MTIKYIVNSEKRSIRGFSMAGTQAAIESSWQYKSQMLCLYSSKSDFDLGVNFATLILLFPMG